MALLLSQQGHRLGSASAPFVIEVFLDYTCPFSAKMFKRLYEEVMPYYEKSVPGKVQLIFRNQVQPWHPQSAYVHEAALAVEQVDQKAFYPYSKILFDAFDKFTDVNTWHKSRQQIYEELAALAPVEKSAVLNFLAEKKQEGTLNYGNAVTDLLKYHIKYARQNSIHVSPTVLLDGIANSAVSSSWTLDQWKELISKQWGLK